VSGKWKRRDLFKIAPAAGLAVAAGSVGLLERAKAETTTHGICRICTMHCGLVGTVRGGQLLRVEGDPLSRTRGFICHHGLAVREIVHAPERLHAPMKRVGDRWTELGWSDALGEIGERLNAIKREYGPQALALQAGWPFVRHPLLPLFMRFARAFGSPNMASVASLCASAGHMGRMLVSGAFLHADLPHTRTLIIWGANPPIAQPPLAHLCTQKALGEDRLIVVDPIRTELAEAASLHLKPRPGSDGALALGMIHLVVRDRLYDAAFVAGQTQDFEALRELVAPYTPERVAALTSVPASDLTKAVQIYARNGPGAVWDSLGVQHHANGVQTVRAITALSALLGYLDVPGGLSLLNRPGPGFWERPLPGFYDLRTQVPAPPPIAAKPIGYDRFPVFEMFNREAQGVLFPEAILHDDPYPLRALLCFASNPLVTYPDAGRWREAAKKIPLLVSVDPFMTETGAAAHYLLPAATFAESAKVDAGDRDAEVTAETLVPPQHDSWPDWKILFGLAQAAGLGSFFPWTSFEEAQRARTEPWMADPARERRPRPMPKGTAPPRFPTASGKIEFASAALVSFGYPALPEWIPPAASTSADYPLWLVSGPRTRAFINSQFRQIPSIRNKELEPCVEVHPDAALRMAIADRQMVTIVSPRGRVEMRARVTDRVHPEIAVVPAGWATASANELTTLDHLDPISGFPVFRSQVCRLEPLGA
jgi:anaerobic selenocysteine-containing dehydrogenase